MPSSKRIPLRDYQAQRIALIKPSALGDIVHSLPILAALRHRYPLAHITWVVNRSYEPLLQGHRDLNATLPFDRGAARHGWKPALSTFGQFLQEFRRHRFDLVVDLQGLLRTGIMAAASGARRRVGLSSAREGALWFYTDVIEAPDRNGMHAVDRYWLVAEAFGVGSLSKSFWIPLSENEKVWAAEILQSYPRPWMMVSAGSRWVTKRWLPDHFAVLARQAQDRFGGSIVLVGGAEERPLARKVAAQLCGPVRDLTGETTLPQLAALLACADVTVANDTGPLHLAVALGRTVVAPYTCTRAAITGPYGFPGHAVETTIWCRGSYLKKCSRMECMMDLTPARVWPVLQEVLLAWQNNRRSA
jgi:lipopolysaccharide heptosyltransferase II